MVVFLRKQLTVSTDHGLLTKLKNTFGEGDVHLKLNMISYGAGLELDGFSIGTNKKANKFKQSKEMHFYGRKYKGKKTQEKMWLAAVFWAGNRSKTVENLSVAHRMPLCPTH